MTWKYDVIAHGLIVTYILLGALAGGVVAALILGLVIGIIATRFYHVLKVNTNQMTINLIDENNI